MVVGVGICWGILSVINGAKLVFLRYIQVGVVFCCVGFRLLCCMYVRFWYFGLGFFNVRFWYFESVHAVFFEG